MSFYQVRKHYRDDIVTFQETNDFQKAIDFCLAEELSRENGHAVSIWRDGKSIFEINYYGNTEIDIDKYITKEEIIILSNNGLIDDVTHELKKRGFSLNNSFIDNNLFVRLELEKEMEGRNDEIFYRYAVGDFKLWFTQNIENGNIYSVGLREQGTELTNFDLYVLADEEGKDGYYPNQFFLSGRSGSMTTDEARKYILDMNKACTILDKVKEFFKTSKHYEVYCKFHECNKTVDEVLKDASVRSLDFSTQNSRNVEKEKE